MLLWLFFPFIWDKIGFKNKALNINLIEQKILEVDKALNSLESKKIEELKANINNKKTY